MARHMVTVETVTVKRWSRKAAARRRVGTGDTSKTLREFAQKIVHSLNLSLIQIGGALFNIQTPFAPWGLVHRCTRSWNALSVCRSRRWRR